MSESSRVRFKDRLEKVERARQKSRDRHARLMFDQLGSKPVQVDQRYGNKDTRRGAGSDTGDIANEAGTALAGPQEAVGKRKNNSRKKGKNARTKTKVVEFDDQDQIRNVDYDGANDDVVIGNIDNPLDMMSDIEAIEKYRELPIIDVNMRIVSKHALRPDDLSTCIYCGSSDKLGQDTTKDHLLAKLVKCGDTDCQHKFHLHCITHHHSITLFIAQYTVLLQNQGTLKCADHYCETCVTHNFQQKAFLGPMIRADGQIRAFHDDICCPPSDEWNGDKIVLPKRTEYKGDHDLFCLNCGKLENKAVIKTNPLKKFISCGTCRNSVHKGCHGINERETHCEDCLYDTQLRKQDPVLVKADGYPRAARMISWRSSSKGNETKIQFVSRPKPNQEVNEVWISLNEVSRAYPLCANTIFHSIREVYSKFAGTAEQSEMHRENLKQIREDLEEYFRYTPHIQREIPKFMQNYVLHESIPVEVSRHFEKAKNSHCRKDLVLKMTEQKGYGVFASNNIPEDSTIGFYIGEIIGKEEHARRSDLASASHDRERKFYVYDTDMVLGKRTEKCYIDASHHKNITSMINSSCNPNCKTEKVEIMLEEGVSITLLKIVSVVALEAGEEVTINYNWKNLDCLCNASKCKTKQKSLDWDLIAKKKEPRKRKRQPKGVVAKKKP